MKRRAAAKSHGDGGRRTGEARHSAAVEGQHRGRAGGGCALVLPPPVPPCSAAGSRGKRLQGDCRCQARGRGRPCGLPARPPCPGDNGGFGQPSTLPPARGGSGPQLQGGETGTTPARARHRLSCRGAWDQLPCPHVEPGTAGTGDAALGARWSRGMERALAASRWVPEVRAGSSKGPTARARPGQPLWAGALWLVS